MLYRILYDDVNINVFSINQDSGKMILQNNIDEDEYRNLIVNVEAKDLGSPQPLTSVVPVYVTIVDENDNGPIFDESSYRYVWCNHLSPSKMHYEFPLPLDYGILVAKKKMHLLPISTSLKKRFSIFLNILL